MHRQEGARKSTAQLFFQFESAKSSGPFNDIFMSENNLFFGKQSVMFDVLLNAIINLLGSHNSVDTIEVVFTFVFYAIPKYPNESMRSSVRECFTKNIVPHWS